MPTYEQALEYLGNDVTADKTAAPLRETNPRKEGAV